MNVTLKPKQRIVRKTLSVCPVCLERIDASIIHHGNDYFMEKECSKHGSFKTVVWRGDQPSYEDWGSSFKSHDEDALHEGDCPTGCGLCANHQQKTCCALVEVTSNCNMNCPMCYAGSKPSGPEPTVEELYERFKCLVQQGSTFVQLSGGEPTSRHDLPDIIAAAKLAGCENIQLNTNGVWLGKDRKYAKALRDAGLSFVFMQFDGTEDIIHKKLRNRALLWEKTSAIRNCGEAAIGVTLVPTIVPGVNCHNIGSIIDFAISNSPFVRGVHFQPITYIGRYPKPPENDDRITLPEVLRAIDTQTNSKFKSTDFAPSRCDHPYCGFHGDFVILPKKAILKLTKRDNESCCGDDAHLRNRNFVARRWNRSIESEESVGDLDDYTELDAFSRRIKSHGFTITAMAFQDAYNLDIARLQRCSLHVSHQDKMAPFCARYLTL